MEILLRRPNYNIAIMTRSYSLSLYNNILIGTTSNQFFSVSQAEVRVAHQYLAVVLSRVGAKLCCIRKAVPASEYLIYIGQTFF